MYGVLIRNADEIRSKFLRGIFGSDASIFENRTASLVFLRRGSEAQKYTKHMAQKSKKKLDLISEAFLRVIFCLLFGNVSSSIVDASPLDVKNEVSGNKSFTPQSHQLQGAAIFKMYEQRQKKLERVEGLLKESKPEKTLVEKKLALLMKLYRQQYSTFEAQISSKNMGLNPNANLKYRNIIKEMKGLLEGMNQQDIPYIERYQKAIYCHELFSDLEALLRNPPSKETKTQLGIEERLSHGRQALNTGGSGEMDYAARKRGDLSREEELENANPVIVVSGSVGKQHGLDKLIEEDLE